MPRLLEAQSVDWVVGLMVVDKTVSAGQARVAGAMDTAVAVVLGVEAEVVMECVRESGTGWRAD